MPIKFCMDSLSQSTVPLLIFCTRRKPTVSLYILHAAIIVSFSRNLASRYPRASCTLHCVETVPNTSQFSKTAIGLLGFPVSPASKTVPSLETSTFFKRKSAGHCTCINSALACTIMLVNNIPTRSIRHILRIKYPPPIKSMSHSQMRWSNTPSHYHTSPLSHSRVAI